MHCPYDIRLLLERTACSNADDLLILQKNYGGDRPKADLSDSNKKVKV